MENPEPMTPKEAFEAWERGELTNSADFKAITGQDAPESSVGPMLNEGISLGGVPHSIEEADTESEEKSE
jgi:hypothetical protein